MKENARQKRIEAKELRCKHRQALQEVIPLPAPYVVYIEPSNLCNFKCKFCPTGDKALLKQVGRPAGSMSLELYKKIINDLKEFDVKLRLLSLYKDGEPLVNRHFADMVQYAKEASVADRIWTKTNGALLCPELNEQIVSAGIDMICISVEGVTRDAYRSIADVDIDYEAFRDNLRDLYERRRNCEIYIKIADSGLSSEEIEKFYRDFEPFATKIAVEKLMGWSYSNVKDFTLGTNPTTYDGLPLIPKEVCAYPFYVLVVNFNGTVSLCGNDWSHNTVVGDASRKSLKSIWEGDALFEFRKMMLEGRRKENKACGDCYYLQIVPDNIDAYSAEILEKLTLARKTRDSDREMGPP